jgi:hypothetical protein
MLEAVRNKNARLRGTILSQSIFPERLWSYRREKRYACDPPWLAFREIIAESTPTR